MIAAVFAVFAACLAVAARNSQPDVVLVHADNPDHGVVECCGATRIKTRNIDRTAAQRWGLSGADAETAASTPSGHFLPSDERAIKSNGYGPIFLRDSLVVDDAQLTHAGLFRSVHGCAESSRICASVLRIRRPPTPRTRAGTLLMEMNNS